MTLLSRFFGLWRRFGGQRADAPGRRLYHQALNAARRPAFFREGGVADTVDGRFDLLIAHVFLLIRRLNADKAQALSQAVFDSMFADMDDSLREMGISDTAVGKRIKDMAQVFYGRVHAYGAAMDAGDEAALQGALHRNLLGAKTDKKDAGLVLAAYMICCETALAAQGMTQLLRSGPCYPPFASQP